MNNPDTKTQTQAEIGNAKLISVSADSQTQRATLRFDRDVLLLAEKLPVQFCDSTAVMQDVKPQAIWRRDAPGAISVELPWAIGMDDRFFVFLPEQMTALRSITGGRVLAAVMWGMAT